MVVVAVLAHEPRQCGIIREWDKGGGGYRKKKEGGREVDTSVGVGVEVDIGRCAGLCIDVFRCLSQRA